jgi:hypothetical protein
MIEADSVEPSGQLPKNARRDQIGNKREELAGFGAKSGSGSLLVIQVACSL